jgi:hypothetical protein
MLLQKKLEERYGGRESGLALLIALLANPHHMNNKSGAAK